MMPDRYIAFESILEYLYPMDMQVSRCAVVISFVTDVQGWFADESYLTTVDGTSFCVIRQYNGVQ
jgi:hypothetical protein